MAQESRQIYDIHAYLGGSLIPGIAQSAQSITAEMESAGIKGSVLLSAHARQVDPLVGNRVLRRVLDTTPHLFGCLVTHANRLDASIATMREQMSARRFVAMAIAPNRPEAPIDFAIANPIVNAYRRYGKPLFYFARDGASARAGLEIAKAYPMVRIVLLGMGGDDWRAAIAGALSATNLLLETSGSMDRAKIPAAIEAVGPHRLLFGSSSPHIHAGAALGLIEDCELGEPVRRRILGENAEKLLGLDAISEAGES